MTKTEQRALAAAAAATHAITKLPAGAARAPSHEPDDNDALREAAERLAEEQTQAAIALAEAQEHGQPAPVSAPARKGTGVRGWAKADAVYHAQDAVIEYVAPNPKKPGSETHRRYNAAYAVGRTIAEAKKLGATAGDILWDLPRGFIRLAAPKTQAE